MSFARGVALLWGLATTGELPPEYRDDCPACEGKGVTYDAHGVEHPCERCERAKRGTKELPTR